MECAKNVNKVILIIIVQLIFISSYASAETADLDQRYLSRASLLDNVAAEQPIVHSQLYAESQSSESQQYELYAMADSSYESNNSSSGQNKSGADQEKWHKYLGYGTVLMAGLTAVTSSEEDFHKAAANVTAVGALSTLITGYLAHGHRFDTDQGLLSKDNLHITLGALGAVILTTAVVIADGGERSGHSGLGVAGGVLMTVGVVNIKW